MDDPLIDELSSYIAAQILRQPDRKVTLDEPLISSGLIDSFSLVDLSIFIEDEYGVRIDDTELNADTFDSLAELAALVKARQ